MGDLKKNAAGPWREGRSGAFSTVHALSTLFTTANWLLGFSTSCCILKATMLYCSDTISDTVGIVNDGSSTYCQRTELVQLTRDSCRSCQQFVKFIRS